MFYMLKSITTLLCISTILLGCDAQEASKRSLSKTAQGETISLELTGYNHTENSIGSFSVNGTWGGNITPGSGGGSFVCCVKVPKPWREGYSVNIEWENHEGKFFKTTALIPKYNANDLSDFNVHFLQDGRIKVFATRVMLGHPDYPLQGAEAKMPISPSEKIK